MKLYYTQASPFVRKVSVTIIELGLRDRVQVIPTRWPHTWATQTVEFMPEFIADTPVGRIPALVTDEGLSLTDSSVICEYLNAEFGNYRLMPASGAARWRMLSVVSIANAVLEAHVSRRAELLRPAAERSQDFIKKMADRQMRCYCSLDAAAAGFGAEPDLAQICCGAACGYADFRFPQDDWRAAAPALGRWYDRFALRPSMRETMTAETPT